MFIDEFHERHKREAANIEKEIKVRISLDYHIKLHTVKVVRGQNISETVKEALAHYFEGLRADAVASETPVAPIAAVGE